MGKGGQRVKLGGFGSKNTNCPTLRVWSHNPNSTNLRAQILWVGFVRVIGSTDRLSWFRTKKLDISFQEQLHFFNKKASIFFIILVTKEKNETRKDKIRDNKKERRHIHIRLNRAMEGRSFMGIFYNENALKLRSNFGEGKQYWWVKKEVLSNIA